MLRRVSRLAATAAATAMMLGAGALAAQSADAATTDGAVTSTGTSASLVTPDGQGPPVTLSCGSAQLVVTASNHQYLLILKSILGTITGGVYTITTNGLGDVPVPGFVKVNGTATSTTPGTIPLPGVFLGFAGTAYATGAVDTSQGATCLFSVWAPWN